MLGTVVVAWFLFPGVVVAVSGVFLDRVVDATEDRLLPAFAARQRRSRSPPPCPRPCACSGSPCLLNLLALPLYFVPLVNLPIWLALNGYLVAREYVELVGLRRLPPAMVATLRRDHRMAFWLAGALIALPARRTAGQPDCPDRRRRLHDPTLPSLWRRCHKRRARVAVSINRPWRVFGIGLTRVCGEPNAPSIPRIFRLSGPATPVAVTHRELQGSPSCSARKTAIRSVRPASATSPPTDRACARRSKCGRRPSRSGRPRARWLPPPARQPRPCIVADEPGKRLIVGHGISLSGEITACDRLVVDGSVQVTLNQTRAIEITESGRFTNGKAEVEEAEISGVYEGDLTVRNRLLIRSTGQVKGTVRYGEIEVERGGRISGVDLDARARRELAGSSAAGSRLARERAAPRPGAASPTRA